MLWPDVGGGGGESCGRVCAFESELINGEWTDGQDMCRSSMTSSSGYLKSVKIKTTILNPKIWNSVLQKFAQAAPNIFETSRQELGFTFF